MKLLALALVLLIHAVVLPCSAHAVGVSRGDYRRTEQGLEVSLTFAATELAALGEPADVVRRLEVRTTSACSGMVVGARSLEHDGLRLEARFECSGRGPVHVSLARLLVELSRGHRHEATTADAQALLFDAHPELVVAGSAAVSATDPPHAPTGLFAYVRLGIEHIVTGYDHLVFLLGLVVIGLGLRRTLLVTGAFTLAHSVTLAVSVLGLWTPPSALVEPAIALSIAYIGIENLLRPQSPKREKRALLAFGFGLVHGFGFASALNGIELRGLGLVRALAGFNLGVELGQLSVLALLSPLVALALAERPIAHHVVRVVSLGVALSGLVWFVARLDGGA